jgi:hypothetical protein
VKNPEVAGILIKLDAQMQQELLQNADGKILDGVILRAEVFQEEQIQEGEELELQLALIVINMMEIEHYAPIKQ